MDTFTAADAVFMARALRLAARGRYTAHPNPMVGCVVVADEVIVGEGFHEVAGEAHAEVNALAMAGARARGARVYVTLEPCVHHGKTPPCVIALAEAGVGEVVVAMEDPYPEVRGRGLEALRQAGITVRQGLMAGPVGELLAGFTSRIARRRPLVRVKIAASMDGAIAMRNGDSQWITGPAARADVQRLRARSGAVMTGIGTVLADDPSLTVRDPAIDMRGRQPLRAVLDPGLRMPLSAEMLTLPGTTLVYCSDGSAVAALEAAGAEVMRVAADDDGLALQPVLEDLAVRGVNELLVEAGPRLTGSLLAAGLVDELVIYQAPHIMGSETLRMFGTPSWNALSDRVPLVVADVRAVGRDLRIRAIPGERC